MSDVAGKIDATPTHHMPMDPKICHEHLATLLAEESDALARLDELLREEHEVLGKNDVTALERTSCARQDQVASLMRVEEQRRSLCRMHGLTPDPAGLRQLIALCDPTGSLAARLRKCAERAARCRELNDRNGVLVAARLKRVAGMLGILTGRGDPAPTYGPQGGASGARPGRVLGAA
jgi:flagella synthesis protein FlgN